MENLVFTQLSIPEIRQLFRQELQDFFKENLNNIAQTQPEADQLLTIQQAAKFLSLSVPTLYGLVSKSEIPVSKRGKRLYFSKQELTEWIRAGRKKTNTEIEKETDTFISSRKKK